MRLITVPLITLVLLIVGRSDPAVHAQHVAQTGVTIQPILSTDFSEVPLAPAFIALTRYTLPPGTSIASGQTTGPRIVIVESGEVTIRYANTDTGFLRAADAPTMAGVGGPDVTLFPGDHYLPIDPTSFQLRNDGGRAAAFLDAIVFPKAPLGIVPYTTMDGVVVDPLVAGVADTMPAAPVELGIERLDVANGQQLALTAAPGPRLFVVESGTLGLGAETGVITDSAAAGSNPGSTAGRVHTVAPGSESLLTARGSVVVQAGASGTARNLGRTRLVLLSLSLLPAMLPRATDRAAEFHARSESGPRRLPCRRSGMRRRVSSRPSRRWTTRTGASVMRPGPGRSAGGDVSAYVICFHNLL